MVIIFIIIINIIIIITPISSFQLIKFFIFSEKVICGLVRFERANYMLITHSIYVKTRYRLPIFVGNTNNDKLKFLSFMIWIPFSFEVIRGNDKYNTQLKTFSDLLR